ncbi:7790_t:CDS:2 [Paraglomus occultum]|uniref:Nucleotide exchange factor SIL1 n=1 Tax=Paraglomus occultum TaxID=144539 RepID=A0A9N9AHT8_9GLOM|nr:7790_t:CDS:2 [Paraglomus occultum]
MKPYERLYHISSLLLLALLLALLSHTTRADVTTDPEICNNHGECYPRIFEATEEYKEVRPDQEIPPGLLVRINMETGKKYAKLNDNSPVTDVQTIDISNAELDSENSSPYNNSSSQPVAGPKVTFHGHLPQNHTDNHSPNKKIPLSEHERFDDYVNILKNDNIDVKELLGALEELEDLVHELEFGIKLAKGEGLELIVKLFEHDENRVKKMAAVVVGSAMQNNPKAQSLSQTHNLIAILLKFLSTERNAQVASRFLYALSSIVRGSSSASESLARHYGLSVLIDTYVSSTSDDYRAKCALFVTDLLDPNMMASDKKVYLEQGDGMKVLPETGILSEWCDVFQATLFEEGTGNARDIKFDTREKVLGGLVMIKKRFPEICEATDGLRIWLREQKTVASEQELDDYYIFIEKARKLFDFDQ